MKVMQIELPEEYRELPVWLLRMSVLHGVSYAEDVMGLDEDKNTAKYKKVVTKEAIHFLKEGIEESLTPHMQNPTTPIAEDAFLEQPFFAIDGTFFTEHVADKDQKEKFYRLIKSAVNTLALVYMDSAMKVSKSGYAFPKGGNADIRRQKVLNRYKRVFAISSIMALLEPLFRTNPKGLNKFLEDKLAAHADDLNKPEFRAQFIKSIRNQIVNEGFNVASLKKIL